MLCFNIKFSACKSSIIYFIWSNSTFFFYLALFAFTLFCNFLFDTNSSPSSSKIWFYLFFPIDKSKLLNLLNPSIRLIELKSWWLQFVFNMSVNEIVSRSLLVLTDWNPSCGVSPICIDFKESAELPKMLLLSKYGWLTLKSLLW